MEGVLNCQDWILSQATMNNILTTETSSKHSSYSTARTIRTIPFSTVLYHRQHLVASPPKTYERLKPAELDVPDRAHFYKTILFHLQFSRLYSGTLNDPTGSCVLKQLDSASLRVCKSANIASLTLLIRQQQK